MPLASAVAPSTVQHSCCVRIDQHSETITQAVHVRVYHNGTLIADAAAQHPSQTQQGAAAAHFAALATAIADDLAVGTQNSFQERNGA